MAEQPSAGFAATVVRQRVDKMSAEVVDSNPYSRLMALQRMGIVKDYERIRHKTVSYYRYLIRIKGKSKMRLECNKD